MLIKNLMNTERFFKLVAILFIFLVACTSNKVINTADSCIIFEQKKNWYKATKASYDKWKTPIALQLSIINQESSFSQFNFQQYSQTGNRKRESINHNGAMVY